MRARQAAKVAFSTALLFGCGNHATPEPDGFVAIGGRSADSADGGLPGAATTRFESSQGGRDTASFGGGSGNLNPSSSGITGGNTGVGGTVIASSSPAHDGGAPSASTTSAGGAKASGGRSSGVRPNGGSIAIIAAGGKSTSPSGSGGKANPTATGGRTSGGTSASEAKGGTTGASSSSTGTGGCLDGSEAVVPSGYELVWADEFNVEGKPDNSNWGYESGFVRNEEAQWYQPDNAWVEKGCLVIEGRRERKSNPNYKSGSTDWKTSRQYAEYTSSSLRTMGKRTWLYGRFEMRGRIVAQTGLWPAWWTLGESKEWPSCGEIDIMEYYAGAIRANVACGTSTRWQAKWDGAAVQVATFAKNWDTQFHVWRMDWDDQKIDLLLDDKQLNTSKLSDMLNSDGSSPFKQPHYMLVNLAIGGKNGGDPSKTNFPTRFEVDYIRVYQKL